MAPTPQEHGEARQRAAPAADGERVVISGMSGLYPNSPHVKELERILYDKENPITSERSRWSFRHPEVRDHTGKVPGLDRFDGQFFKVHFRMGNCMDPMSRKILEQTYQAIYDAGVSPEHLSGKKVGVYIGSCFSETEKSIVYTSIFRDGLGIVGCSKAMFANRISYWLNAKGPSITIDESCCSSIAALEQAYQAIMRGECEAAIVGGCNLCLHPQSSVHYNRIMALCLDGKTKSFDINTDGLAKSEAINVLFLQRAKDAMRIYAEILHVKSEFSQILNNETGGPKYGFYRDASKLAEFMKQFYEEAKVLPQAVEYVEAFGCAVSEVDKAELEAIEEVYCKNRQDPLLVGSVMSNIGYGEAASGISAITKVLLGYQNGLLAANLHCSRPRRDVAALRDGRMQIVTEHRRFGRSYAAVNGISVTGVNAHVLLRGHYKPKDLDCYKSAIPRLVAISGRQETAVQKILDDLKSRSVDAEELALFHNIHQARISGHMGRGYIILDTNEEGKTIAMKETVSYFDDMKRPLWFVYSGMGSQWAGMGTQLMKIPVFAAAIERCHKILKPKGVDIVHVITSPDKTIFNNILNSFVGIAATQIGLTDVLTSLGIMPDKIIGHSVGELGCAYADGCLTAEEMILSAYSRGLVSVQTPFIRGSMAAVGIGYKKIIKLLPPEIEVACHNGPESCTISGPADNMKQFVEQLTEIGIFAKEVPCSNIAYHSRYIAEAGPALLKYLSEVIKEPRLRSDRWVSTSVPRERWDEEKIKFSSAYYHTNNLLNPVLFEETSRLIPANAVTVEIAPHGLLQAILKRSLPESCNHIPLTRRGHTDNAFMVLDAVGKLYMEGYLPKIQVLYPAVQFPVSTGTPMLSHLVEWAHTERWQVIGNFLILLGKNLYPFSAALMAAWDTLAMSLNQKRKQISVEFRDVQLHAQPALLQHKPLRLNVSLHRANGLFEILTEDRLIASGYIFSKHHDSSIMAAPNFSIESKEIFEVTSDNVYNMLWERDYFYSGDFRSIHKVNKTFTEAQILWNNNWVTFLDGIFQFNALRTKHDTVAQPFHVTRIFIDLKKHDAEKYLCKEDSRTVVLAQIIQLRNILRCGGILMENIQSRKLPVLDVPISIFDYESKLPIHIENKEGAGGVPSLYSTRIGNLDSLHWAETRQQLGSEVTVIVHYSAINDIDVKRATGVISSKKENTYGMDFSGISQCGERVMGVVESGALSSRVVARPELMWPVPAHWSLEDAATVPSAYAHAFYILHFKTGFLQGFKSSVHTIHDPSARTKILVHGATGALGQALISILLAHDCEVFATVSDIRKKRFLMTLFPQLQENHIGNSRDQSFGDMVLNLTRGQGCNFIFSCLKASLKNACLRCLATNGIMIDTVQIPTQENFSYGMFNLTRARNYCITDFGSIFHNNEIKNMKKLQVLISEGISKGYVRPLSRVTFSPEEANRAFRLLGASHHCGRVLIKMHAKIPIAEPRLACSPYLYQVIICGESKIGLQFAERLISRGAKNLRLHCTNPSNFMRLKIQAWEVQNIKVEILSKDLADSKNVFSLLGDEGSLIENNNLIAVEGIYIMATDVNQDETEHKWNDVVKFLDLAATKLCTSLRYFVVVSNGHLVGQLSNKIRAERGLPCTLLHLPTLWTANNFKHHEMNCTDFSSRRSAINAIEKAIMSTYRVLVARPKNFERPSLMQEIADIAEIRIPNEINESTTLQDLGIDLVKVPQICSHLRDTHDLAFSEEALPSLTIRRIEELNGDIRGTKLEKMHGLGSFFQFVDPDELQGTIETVLLPTLVSSFTKSNEFDVSQTYLCIIPGLEGNHGRFQTLCERLKLPALVLQPGLDLLHESLRETAQRYANVLLKQKCIHGHFYLLGYESGVSVALEVASILEDQGYTGTVFCLGGTPEEFQALLEDELSDFPTDEALQDAVVRHMFSLMTGHTEGIDKALHSVFDWTQKVEVSVRMLLGQVSHSSQYARNFIEAAYAKVKAARSYEVQPRELKSKLVLLHASSLHSEQSAVASLQRYSQQPVKFYQLEETLPRAALDLRCSAIINENLDSSILNAFEQFNLCEIYVTTKELFKASSSLDN